MYELCGRSVFWWLNVGGIGLEIFGALVIVWSAFRTRSRIKNVPDSWDAELPIKLRDIVSGQAVTELFGFLLLAIGLLGQLISAFE